MSLNDCVMIFVGVAGKETYLPERVDDFEGSN